jgi:molybdate transport system regulatory protein
MEPSIITSVVTEEAVEKLDIKPGDRIYAVIKSTEVMVAKTISEKGQIKAGSKETDHSN